jgi:PAS domain S-box-containing protein
MQREMRRLDHELQSRQVIDAIAQAVIVTDPAGRILLWSDGAQELFGWEEDQVLGRPIVELVAVAGEDEAADDQLRRLAWGEGLFEDCRVVHRDGTPMNVAVANRPIVDGDGTVIALVGVFRDLTQLRHVRSADSDLAERLQLALEAGGLGTWHWHADDDDLGWDTGMERLHGLKPGTFGGRYDDWLDLVHEDDRVSFREADDAAFSMQGNYATVYRSRWPDGTIHWLSRSVHVTRDPQGRPTGTIGCVDEITEQVVADEARDRATAVALEAAESERLHRLRLEFLAAVNRSLSETRQRDQELVAIPRAAAPGFADWCALFVAPGSDPDRAGEPPDMAAAATQDGLVDEMAERAASLVRGDPESTVRRVIATGRREFCAHIEAAHVDETSADAQTAMLVEHGMRSVMIVPVVKRGRTLGAMQLARAGTRTRYTTEDVEVAEAAAARIASSLTNLRLLEHEQFIARTLQDALLPAEIPTIPGCDIAVRYWAAGEAVEVGGDFYDVFETVEGRWAAIVGDVCGKGPVAAAMTAVSRHSIRMSAWHGDQPADVLRWLNHALVQTGSDGYCTAVYAMIQRTDDGDIVLTSALGGHPHPLLCRPDGRIEKLGTSGTILGMFREISCTETTTVIRSGDVVILYTDGIADLPPPYGLDEDELIDFVQGCLAEGGTADEIADRMFTAITEMLPLRERSDDIAVLVLRVV